MSCTQTPHSFCGTYQGRQICAYPEPGTGCLGDLSVPIVGGGTCITVAQPQGVKAPDPGGPGSCPCGYVAFNSGAPFFVSACLASCAGCTPTPHPTPSPGGGGGVGAEVAVGIAALGLTAFLLIDTAHHRSRAARSVRHTSDIRQTYVETRRHTTAPAGGGFHRVRSGRARAMVSR